MSKGEKDPRGEAVFDILRKVADKRKEASMRASLLVVSINYLTKKHSQTVHTFSLPIRLCYDSTYLQRWKGFAETRKNEEANNVNQPPAVRAFSASAQKRHAAPQRLQSNNY